MDGLPAEVHADRLAARERSWTTIEVTSTHTLHSIRGPDEARPLAIDEIRSRYIEAKSTGRYLEEVFLLGKEFENKTTHTFDGTMGLEIRADTGGPTSAMLISSFANEAGSGRTERPMPLDRLWVGKIPLAEALTTAERLGASEVWGRACDVFVIQDDNGRRTTPRVYALDRETSLPVKLVLYRDEATRAADRPMIVWEATEIARAGDYPYVKHAIESDFTRPDGSLSIRREFDVESIALDGPVKPSTFAPTLPMGVSLVDARAPTTSTYLTSLNTVATTPSLPFPSTPATILPPPVARDRPAVGLGTAIAVALALGVVLLGVRHRSR